LKFLIKHQIFHEDAQFHLDPVRVYVSDGGTQGDRMCLQSEPSLQEEAQD
jgi:hypothetical protein